MGCLLREPKWLPYQQHHPQTRTKRLYQIHRQCKQHSATVHFCVYMWNYIGMHTGKEKESDRGARANLFSGLVQTTAVHIKVTYYCALAK